MKTPVLSDAQKEALLKGEWSLQSKVHDVLLDIVTQYKSISHITEDSFTALGDRGTRKLATAIAGKDASKVQMMAATQIAYFLTGQKELIAPSVTMALAWVKTGNITKFKSLPYMLSILAGKEITEEEIIAKHKAYRTYEVEDLEKSIEHIQKDIDELTNGAHKLLGNVNVAGEAVNMMINLLNRDLKIVTAMATIQGCLKSLGEKIAADKEREEVILFSINI